MATCTRCSKVPETVTEDVNIDDCYNLIISLLPEAGRLAMEGFNKTRTETTTKRGEWDLVTLYDTAIENLFVEGIRKFYPSHVFLAEETASTWKLSDKPTWIIDPIDGTTNFVHGFPMFAIAIAFSVNKEVKFGITYNPALNEMYTARKGQGAFLNGEPISCSKTRTMETALCLADPLFQIEGPIRKKCLKRLYKIGTTTRGVRMLGSAAMQLVYVASGKYDFYLVEDLQPWDLAAGSILVKEAGGIVSNCDGSPYNVLGGSIAVAGTPELWETAVQAYKDADESSLSIE